MEEVELRESGEKRLSICAFCFAAVAVEERVLSIQRCLALLLPNVTPNLGEKARLRRATMGRAGRLSGRVRVRNQFALPRLLSIFFAQFAGQKQG